MNTELPTKVLITGGREVGGLSTFAEGLREGFAELGVPAEIVRPSRILSHWRELRDPGVLKILSLVSALHEERDCFFRARERHLTVLAVKRGGENENYEKNG